MAHPGRRHPAPVGRQRRLCRGHPHRRGDPQGPGRRLPPPPQHPALSCSAPLPASARPSACRSSEMPELERWVLHRLKELDAARQQLQRGLRLPRALSARCTASAPPSCRPSTSTSARMRSTATGRTARAGAPPAPCSTPCSAASPLWLAPVLVFTAEEAWRTRFPSETGSVHLELFPELPEAWLDPGAGGALRACPPRPPRRHRRPRGRAAREAHRRQPAGGPDRLGHRGRPGGDRRRRHGRAFHHERARPRGRVRFRPGPSRSRTYRAWA